MTKVYGCYKSTTLFRHKLVALQWDFCCEGSKEKLFALGLCVWPWTAMSLKWESATHTGPLGPVQAFICLPLRMSAKRGWICVLHPAECTEMKPNKLWGGTWTCHLCSSTQGFVRCLSPMLQDIFKSQNLTLGQCIKFYLIVWAINLQSKYYSCRHWSIKMETVVPISCLEQNPANRELLQYICNDLCNDFFGI